MNEKNALPGVRTIDLRHVMVTHSAGWAVNRQLAGGAVALGFHGLILLALLWAPVGELKTLGITPPGATWITLAPLDTGVAAEFDASKPALLFNRPIIAEDVTVPLVEPTLDIEPATAPDLMASETQADSKPAGSPALPALGDFPTAQPGEGGSNDPYAGAALPRRGGMVTPAPAAEATPQAATVQFLLRAGALDALRAELGTRLAASAFGDAGVTHTLDLLVRVNSDGVVEDAYVVNATVPPGDLIPLLRVMIGQRLFDVPPGQDQDVWQSLSLTV